MDDPLIDRENSVIAANVKGSSGPICGISYVGQGWFTLKCTGPPSEGSSLRYAVINSEPLPPPGQINQDRAVENEIKESYENMTSQGPISNQTIMPMDNMTLG